MNPGTTPATLRLLRGEILKGSDFGAREKNDPPLLSKNGPLPCECGSSAKIKPSAIYDGVSQVFHRSVSPASA
jgi:hypothetical protein